MSACTGKENWLQALHEIGMLSTAGNVSAVPLARAIGIVRGAVGCDAASLFLCDGVSGELTETASAGAVVTAVDTERFGEGDGFAGWLAKQGKPVLLNPQYMTEGQPFESILCAPLLREDRFLGVVNLGHGETDAFTGDHVTLAELFARQMVQVIERAQIKEAVANQDQAPDEKPHANGPLRDTVVKMDRYRELVRFAVSLNHEICNPLTAIIGNADLILITASNLDDDTRRKIDTIIAEAQRIAHILERLGSLKRTAMPDDGCFG